MVALRSIACLFVAALLLNDCTPSSRRHDDFYKKLVKTLISKYGRTKRLHLRRKQSTLPDYFDWRDVNNTYFVSPVTNQFLPSPCGSCWAHAAVGALTDRMIIATGAKRPIVPLSPQVLLDCKDHDLGSCKGGSAFGAYKFIFKNGITDITCSPYMGVDNFYWADKPCNQTMCRNCDRFGQCSFVNGRTYHISAYGTVTGEKQMMSEVFSRGPIACSVFSHKSPFHDYTGGIIQDATIYNRTSHAVAVTGWGQDNKTGMKYWLGRNSYGTMWGEEGWFKLQRGVNALDIEKHICAWAVPKM